MPPRLLFDISTLDLDRVAISRDEIREANPQRFEFEQIDFSDYFADVLDSAGGTPNAAQLAELIDSAIERIVGSDCSQLEPECEEEFNQDPPGADDLP